MRRVLRRGRELVGDHPGFLPLVRWSAPEPHARRLTSSTELVIEGFPRSGNTFAYWALQLAQGRAVDIASHVHVPAQVKLAVRMGKPTLFVVREPLGCLASNLTSCPHVRFDAILREYAHHHREVLPYAPDVVVGTFEQTTGDLTILLEALNTRFGTSFRPFEASEENVARVFALLEAHYRRVWGDRANERLVPRPSPARHAEKRWLTDQLTSSRYSGLLEEADAAYAALAAHAPRRGALPATPARPGTPGPPPH